MRRRRTRTRRRQCGAQLAAQIYVFMQCITGMLQNKKCNRSYCGSSREVTQTHSFIVRSKAGQRT